MQQIDSRENTAPKQEAVPLDCNNDLSILWTLSVCWKSNPDSSRHSFSYYSFGHYMTTRIDGHDAPL
jgi:hypothetical protein